MHDGPAFDVAIRTYNDPLLPRAVESAAAVPCVRRVVIVDDGSPEPVDSGRFDGLAVPVDVVRQENAGAPAARNRAIHEAASEWVVLLDSDDVLLPAVASAVRHASDRGACGAVCARDFVFPGGRVDRRVVPPAAWLEGGLPDAQSVFDHRYPIFSPTGYVVSRQAGIEAGERCDLTIHLAEDLLFSYHLRKIGPVAVFGEPTAFYTVHPSAKGNMTGRSKIEANVDDLLRLYAACYEPSGDGAWRGLLGMWFARYARYGRRGSTLARFLDIARERGWRFPVRERLRYYSRNAQRAMRLRRKT
ncbi:MAG: glycosyltransferase family 2 protein [Planctomycetota bacterium]